MSIKSFQQTKQLSFSIVYSYMVGCLVSRGFAAELNVVSPLLIFRGF